MLGLYLHIPFCAAICNYCNFNRGLLDEALKRRYVDALIGEIRPRGRTGDAGRYDLLWRRHAVAAVGCGDSPDPGRVPCGVCRCARQRNHARSQSRDRHAANRCEGYRAAGVNRLSFGVQSFRDDELRRLGRLHSADTARTALRAGSRCRVRQREPRPDDVAAGAARRSVAAVGGCADRRRPRARLPYLLELYPNAPLREDMARGGVVAGAGRRCGDMYLEALGRLDAAGYDHYEISNVAQPGREARHNVKYWTGRGVAWLRVRRALDAGRRPLAQRSCYHGLRPAGRRRRLGCRRAPGARPRRARRRCTLHRAPTDRRPGFGCDRGALRHRRLAPVRLGAVPGSSTPVC